jgi:hypothetical protein
MPLVELSIRLFAAARGGQTIADVEVVAYVPFIISVYDQEINMEFYRRQREKLIFKIF